MTNVLVVKANNRPADEAFQVKCTKHSWKN